MNREDKQKTNEEIKDLFQGENNKVFWFIPTQTKIKQKQTKTPERTTKEGLWPSEVAQRATSPDP